MSQGIHPASPQPPTDRKRGRAVEWTVAGIAFVLVAALATWILWPKPVADEQAMRVVKGLQEKPTADWTLEFDSPSAVIGAVGGSDDDADSLLVVPIDPTQPLRKVDPDTGKDIWNTKIAWPDTPPAGIFPSVRWSEGSALVQWRGSDDDTLGVMALLDRNKGTVRATGVIDKHQHWSTVADDDFLLVEDHGEEITVARKDGSSFDGSSKWHTVLPVSDGVQGFIRVTDEYVFLDPLGEDGPTWSSHRGHRYLLDVETGKAPDWWKDGPAYQAVGDYISAYSDGELSLLDKDGKKLWSVPGFGVERYGEHYFLSTGEKGPGEVQQLVDITTGKPLWDKPLPNEPRGMVTPFTDETYYFQRGADWTISRIDMETGDLTHLHTMTDRVNGRIVEGEGQMLAITARFCMDTDGRAPSLAALRPDVQEPVWEITSDAGFDTFFTRNMYEYTVDDECRLTGITRLK